MINAKVEANSSENVTSLLRRFNRRVQSSGVIGKAKNGRYRDRATSKYTKKKIALKTLKKRAVTDRLIRLGKITERVSR